MAVKKLEKMSYDELEERLFELGEEKQKVREEALEVHAVMDKKVHEARAKALTENMSAAERESLTQVIKEAGGIESREGVNGRS